ncbi:hypothetical protein EZS27_021879, partial [termite gut metagenome]
MGGWLPGGITGKLLMTMNIGIVCEGVSESNIIRYIIERYLGDDCYVNPIFPKITGKGKQADDGGWLSVLNSCTEEKFDKALLTNDYVVVQIDTDASEEKYYDVKKKKDDGSTKTDEELYTDICERILREISEEKRRGYAGKILFAVCFNETECWLLPIYYADKQKRCSVTNCIFKLNQKITSRKLAPIPDTDKNSSRAIKTYNAILKELKKRKDIKDCSVYNWGFN